MKPVRALCSALIAVAFVHCASAQQAQRAAPHIGYVYPAGGQQGKTITVSIGGQSLVNPSAVYFSVSGLQARILGYDRPMTQKEINDAREKLQQLQEKRAAAQKEKKDAGTGSAKSTWTDADEAMIADLKLKLMSRPGRQTNPAIAETVTLELAIADDVPPGEHELRIKTSAGLSNPFMFCVGQLTEITEAVVTSTSPLINVPRAAPDSSPRTARAKPAHDIAVPAIVNGQILPGEVDRFRFPGKKGQKLTIVASARALIPYLADAVPGWFQPTLALFDAKGRELSYDDDFRFNPDPVVCYQLPADGEYTVEIKDSIYRGREDFVYRLAIGELPFVTGIFPLCASPSADASFSLAGWNLPSDRLMINTADRGVGTFRLNVRNGGQLSNPVRFAIDTDPITMEAEPNNVPERAQTIALPQVVNGRIEKAGDEDLYRFEGKAGMEIVAEIFARRLNSPLDSVLELTDATGKRLAVNDDYEDKGAGLLTHQADSRISFKLPADGAYFLCVRDSQSQGGNDYAYRLRVGPPRPDFELRVAPATLNLRAATSATLTVYALRRDGFNGEIDLGLIDPPRGFGLGGSRIPAGQDKVAVTISAPPSPLDAPVHLAIAGRAVVGEKTITRRAVPAEDMMQAFAYRHLVPAKDLLANVSGRGSGFRVTSRLPLRVSPNGTVKLQLTSSSLRGVNKVRVELVEPPEGISVAKSTCYGEQVEVVLMCDPAKAKAGWAGNLILNINGERPNSSGKAKKTQSWLIGTAPAVPVEIVATLAAST